MPKFTVSFKKEDFRTAININKQHVGDIFSNDGDCGYHVRLKVVDKFSNCDHALKTLKSRFDTIGEAKSYLRANLKEFHKENDLKLEP